LFSRGRDHRPRGSRSGTALSRPSLRGICTTCPPYLLSSLNTREGVMRSSLPPHLGRPVAAVMLTAAWALTAGSGRPADPPPHDDKAKPTETVKVELPRLKNDALLKQAAAIYAKASQDYLATARALAAAEILLGEATEKADGPPEAKTPAPRP